MDDLVEMDDLIDDVLVDLSEEDIVDLTASTAETTTQHFRGDPLIPIYFSGITRPFSSKNIAQEIMSLTNLMKIFPS